MASTNLSILFVKGIDKHLLLKLSTYDPVWREIFHVETTRFRYVDDQTWQGYPLPAFRVPGGPIADGQFVPSYNKHYVIRNYGLKDSFPREDIRDDIYGVINRVIPQKAGLFGRSFMDLYETDTAAFFTTQGFASGSNVAGMSDGKSLFNTAHPISAANSGTTAANRPTVDADLSIATAQAMITNLRTQRYPNNITRMNNGPAFVVYDPSLDFVAHQIWFGQWERGTADRNMNDVRRFPVKLLPWSYFQKSGSTGTNNAWFAGGREHFLYFWMRQSYETDSQPDINTNSEIIAATCRFDEGASDWRGVYGTVGS